jgi:hypothetical protein
VPTSASSHPAYTSHRSARQSPRAARPLSEFDINELEERQPPRRNKQHAASAQNMDLSSTTELAQFLKNTAPPDTGRRSFDSGRDSAVFGGGKKNPFAFLRTGKHGRGSAAIFQLPEGVKQGVTTGGRRYYAINTDKYGESITPHVAEIVDESSPQGQQKSTAQGTTDSPSDNYATQNLNRASSGAKSTSQRATTVEEKRSSAPVLTSRAPRRSELDEETAATYHSYLMTQQRNDEEAAADASQDASRAQGSSRAAAKSGRVSTDSAPTIRTLGEQSTGAPPSYPQVKRAEHSRGVSMVSEAASTRSVAMHSHGLPPRTSSIAQAGKIPPSPAPSRKNSGRSRPQSMDEIASRPLSDRSGIGSVDTYSTGTVQYAQVVPIGKGLAGSSSNSPAAAAVLHNNNRGSPRPGPPPMRSLPSLPEGSGYSGGRSRAESAPQQSPLPEELETPTEESQQEAQEVQVQKKASTRTLPAIVTAEDPHRQAARLRRKEDDGMVSATESMRSIRRTREERVKARKMRDMQSQRAGKRGVADGQARDSIVTEGDDTGTDFAGYTTGGGISDSGSLRAAKVAAAASIRSARRKGLYRNSFSPIMLVVEQEPSSNSLRTMLSTVTEARSASAAGSSSPSAATSTTMTTTPIIASGGGRTSPFPQTASIISPGGPYRHKHRSSKVSSRASRGTKSPTRSVSPSLPSSDEGEVAPSPPHHGLGFIPNSSSGSTGGGRRSHRSSVGSHGPSHSYHHQQQARTYVPSNTIGAATIGGAAPGAAAGTTTAATASGSQQHADLERRMNSIERQNALLQSALLTVIQTSADMIGTASTTGPIGPSPLEALVDMVASRRRAESAAAALGRSGTTGSGSGSGTAS